MSQQSEPDSGARIGNLRSLRTRISVQSLLFQLRAFIALIILFLFFWYKMPTIWVRSDTLIIMTKHVAQNALLGIGATYVILAAGIDLSVGSIVGLTGMVAGGLIYEGLKLPMFGVIVYFEVWVIVLIALLVGVLVGLINGILITRFNVAPFIATLGMLYVARGSAELLSNGQIYAPLSGSTQLGNTGFGTLGAGTLLKLPYPIWLMIIFALIGIFVAQKTPFGRQVYAIGGNPRAAELSGIRVKRILTLTYMISGFFAALVGLIIASLLVASHPDAGNTYELNAIAVVVLGGTSLFGGRGTIGGSIIGAFVIGVLGDGMVLMGISEFWQTVIKGVVIIAAVAIDQFQQRLQERAALARAQAQAVQASTSAPASH
jgi:erythritol transport system permease protein